jgi:hypothetical protein
MPPKSIIESRFSRLKLKDEPIQVDDPVSEDDVNKLMSQISEMFPDLDVTKLQKAHTRKSVSYNKWKKEHCRERKYTFQIKKCSNQECCLPSRLPCEMLKWLPDPVLAEDGDHFMKYNEVIISISYFSKFEELTHFFISIVCIFIKGQRYRNNRKRLPISNGSAKEKEKCPWETGSCASNLQYCSTKCRW